MMRLLVWSPLVSSSVSSSPLEKPNRGSEKVSMGRVDLKRSRVEFINRFFGCLKSSVLCHLHPMENNFNAVEYLSSLTALLEFGHRLLSRSVGQNERAGSVVA